YPAVSLTALGLQHLHLIIDDPRGRWDAFPYATSAEWIVRRPGVASLYLRCVIPAAHLGRVQGVLAAAQHAGLATRIHTMQTVDCWQIMRDMARERADT